MDTTPLIPRGYGTGPGWYVLDKFGRTFGEAYVAGPFTTRAAAEQDRRERNIGDDCYLAVSRRDQSINARRTER
jgi:hypothetical protein